MGGCNWLYISNTPFEDIGMREDLGITPAPQLTAGPLGAVPVVVGLWIVFLTGMHAISKRKDQAATDEKENAVNLVLENEHAKLNETVAQLKEKAKKDQEAAIEREVKKALEEAEKQQAEDRKEEEEEE